MVGALAAVAAMGVAVFFCICRRRRRRQQGGIIPYSIPSSDSSGSRPESNNLMGGSGKLRGSGYYVASATRLPAARQCNSPVTGISRGKNAVIMSPGSSSEVVVLRSELDFLRREFERIREERLASGGAPPSYGEPERE